MVGALLKSLWLSRLPTTTRSIVGTFSDPLLQLASVAGKVHDLGMFAHINEACSTTPALTSSLEAQIAQLTQKVIYGANATKVQTFGTKLLNIGLILHKTLTWFFEVTKVSHPIIDIDFIKKFNLLVD